MTFRSGFVHWDSMRYIALAVILGWAALAFLIDAGAGWRARAGRGGRARRRGRLASAPDPLLHSPVLLVGMAVLAAVVASRVHDACAWSRAVRGYCGTRFMVAVRGDGRGAGVALISPASCSGATTQGGATAAAIYGERFFGEAARVLDGSRRAHASPYTAISRSSSRPAPAVISIRCGSIAMGGWRPRRSPTRWSRERSASIRPTFVSNLQAPECGSSSCVHLPHPGRSVERPSQERALEASGGPVSCRGGRPSRYGPRRGAWIRPRGRGRPESSERSR